MCEAPAHRGPAWWSVGEDGVPCPVTSELLWTAPELLRAPGAPGRGTLKADVFSIGIVLQEVLTRGPPYSSSGLSAEGTAPRPPSSACPRLESPCSGGALWPSGNPGLDRTTQAHLPGLTLRTEFLWLKPGSQRQPCQNGS